MIFKDLKWDLTWNVPALPDPKSKLENEPIMIAQYVSCCKFKLEWKLSAMTTVHPLAKSIVF